MLYLIYIYGNPCTLFLLQITFTQAKNRVTDTAGKNKYEQQCNIDIP